MFVFRALFQTFVVWNGAFFVLLWCGEGVLMSWGKGEVKGSTR